MNESQWIAALDRSDNLKRVAVGNHRIAHAAIRAELHLAAERGEGPVGCVADARYLMPDQDLSQLRDPHPPHRGKPRPWSSAPPPGKPLVPYAGKDSDD
jgi:hypothetical protein